MLTDPALHPTPAAGSVLLEQIRAVGVALRRETVFLAVLVGLLTLVVIYHVVSEGLVVSFEPDLSFLMGGMGFLLPFAVWKGERLFAGGYLWTLPVNRPAHVLAKVLAGYVWLLAATGVIVLWLFALVLLSGGSASPEETRLVLGAGDAGQAGRVTWAAPAWLWFAPFSGATVGYLLASVFAIGVEHRLRVAAAILLGFSVWAALLPETAQPLIDSVMVGRYGLDYVLTGGTHAMESTVALPDGKEAVAWRALPTLVQWAAGSAVWIGLGVACLVAGAFRHRER